MSPREIIHYLRAAVVVSLAVGALTADADATPPTHADISYGTNWRQSLDLYLPPNEFGPFPVVVYIHGGGWLAGDKSLAGDYVDDLLARGIAVAAVNYRFSYQAAFPAQLFDCKGAIRWLRAHAGDYNLDSDRFAAFGESAGGHLASLVGTVFNEPALEGNIGGNTQFSSRVQAVVHGYGPTDLFELADYSVQRGNEISQLIGHDIYDIMENANSGAYAALVALVNSANPAFHAAGNDPPVYLVHGTNDQSVPPSQSQLFAEALDDVGAPETLRLMPGVGHTLPDDELPGIYAFLVEQLTPLPELLSMGGAGVGDSFGQSVAVLGDVNADGVDDIAVGAPLNDDAGVDAGRVTIHSGANGAIIRILRGKAAGDRFGWSIAAAGDVNGDNKKDIIVGSPKADDNGTDSGRVEVFTARNGQRLRTFVGDRAGDQLGTSVSSADVDGDGRRDVVAGAPFADAPLKNSGSVLVFSGADWHLFPRMKGLAKGDQFGAAIAAVGDVDGDSRAEIVIGAPKADIGVVNSGTVSVHGWNGSQWGVRFARTGSGAEQLGTAVAGTGDVDGDGWGDIIVGAPHGVNGNGVAAGLARVYSIHFNATISTLQPVDAQVGEQFGSAVAVAGDVDGDGLPDVMVSSWKHDLAGSNSGRVVVFRGVGGVLHVLDGADADANFGRSLAGRGDVDGDGQPDLIVGASGMFWQGNARGAVYILEPSDSP